MNDRRIKRIDTAWHPLADGNPPDWASGWGQDEHGVWIEFTLKGVTQRLRWIPPGRFRMGSPEVEEGRLETEGPQHQVIIQQGYWLFDTPVTQALWQAVMGDNPSYFKSPDRPVENVNWEDCREFLLKINQRIAGLGLVMPSEAQWEYACRASSKTALYTGEIDILGDANAPALDPIAWYVGNSGVAFELDNGMNLNDLPWLKDRQYADSKAGSHPVKRKQPNAWGLYDMLGNVWEWTADAWHENYTSAPLDGRIWDSEEPGARRVIRGGSWNDLARGCRSACRDRVEPDGRDSLLGFRPARVQV